LRPDHLTGFDIDPLGSEIIESSCAVRVEQTKVTICGSSCLEALIETAEAGFSSAN
jgi:hypothetical protein